MPGENNLTSSFFTRSNNRSVDRPLSTYNWFWLKASFKGFYLKLMHHKNFGIVVDFDGLRLLELRYLLLAIECRS